MIKYWLRKNTVLIGPPRSQNSFTASLQRSESTHHYLLSWQSCFDKRTPMEA